MRLFNSRPAALKRYRKGESGAAVVDVAATKIEDLYEDFDKYAPYIKRDLDQDLVDYIIESAREIGSHPFSICLCLSNPPNEQNISRIRTSVNNYFLYLSERECEKRKKMFFKAISLFTLGSFILIISVLSHEIAAKMNSITANVFAEGLTIAAWVSLWEVLATLLLEWLPYNNSIRLYKQIASINLIFRTESTASSIMQTY